MLESTIAPGPMFRALVSDSIERLLDTYRRPDESRWTGQQLDEATGGAVTRSCAARRPNLEASVLGRRGHWRDARTVPTGFQRRADNPSDGRAYHKRAGRQKTGPRPHRPGLGEWAWAGSSACEESLRAAPVAGAARPACAELELLAEDAGGGPGPPPSGSLSVSFIDVGQGDGVLVQAGGESYLIDAGRPEEGPNVVDFLRSRGVDSLDAIVVTNPRS